MENTDYADQQNQKTNQSQDPENTSTAFSANPGQNQRQVVNEQNQNKVINMDKDRFKKQNPSNDPNRKEDDKEKQDDKKENGPGHYNEDDIDEPLDPNLDTDDSDKTIKKIPKMDTEVR